MEVRSLGERTRNLEYDQSLKNPLYLQSNVIVGEIKKYFTTKSDSGLTIYDFGCATKPYQIFAGSNSYFGIDIDESNRNADIYASR